MRAVVSVVGVVVAGVVLLAQASGVPITITGVPGEAPKTAEEQAVFDQVQSGLADALQGVFPCANPTTTADREGEYQDAKSQQSAGANEDQSLGRMRDAAGAQDVVSVKVTAMNGSFVVDVAYLDMRTGRAQARSNATIDGSQESIDRFAEQFASSLSKLPGMSKMKGCTAERDWRGSIGYRFTADPSSKSQKDNCTSEERTKENWRYTIRIPAAGPATAVVGVTRLLYKESQCIRKGWWCGTAAGQVDQHSYNSQVWQWIGAPRVEPYITFDEVNGKLYTSISMPMIETALSAESDSHYETPCNKDAGKPSKFESKAPIPARVPTIPGQVLKPGQKRLSGSASDGQGGTVTWRLIRTNRTR